MNQLMWLYLLSCSLCRTNIWTYMLWVHINNYSVYIRNVNTCSYTIVWYRKILTFFSCLVWVRFMIFNATFINISVILWPSVLLVEKTSVPGGHHRPVASHWQTLSHNVVLRPPRFRGFRSQNVSGDRHRLHREL